MESEREESPFPKRMYLPPSTRFIRVAVAIQVFDTADAAFLGKRPLQTVLSQDVKIVPESSARDGVSDEDLEALVREVTDDTLGQAQDLWRRE